MVAETEEATNIPFVSVVVPVYNEEKYIHECIESILAQTFDNFELILVDDGSIDDSLKICKEYAANNSLIRVLSQENAGQGKARNYGVQNARGEYIVFVDSDDIISPDHLEYMVKLTLEFSSDITMTQLASFKGEHPNYCQTNEEYECISSPEAVNRMFYQEGLDVGPCGKLIKKILVEQYPFPENMIYEDFAVMYKIALAGEKVVHAKTVKYYYRYVEDSTSNAAYTPKHDVIVPIALEALEYIRKENLACEKAAIRRYLYSNFHLLNMMLLADKLEYTKYKKIKKNITPYKFLLLLDKRAKFVDKIKLISILAGLKIYTISLKAYKG